MQDRQSYGGGAAASPSFVIGKKVATGERLEVPLMDLMTSLYALGVTGSGKTWFLLNLALRAAALGLGLAFFTPHGDAIDDFLKRLPPSREKDVILLDLASLSLFGLNLFQCDLRDDYAISLTLQRNIELFGKLFTDSGDLAKEAIMMYSALTAVTMLMIYNQSYALTDVPDILNKKEMALGLARNLPDEQATIRHWWEELFTLRPYDREQRIGSFQRRLTTFLTDSTSKCIFGVTKTTIDLRHAIENRSILLVKLDRRRPSLTSLVGATLIALLAACAYSREDTPEELRQPFLLVCDEFQRFATPSFAELLSEVRKYRIATVVAHQFRDQLDMENKGATLNAGNKVIFAIQGNDAQELEKEFTGNTTTAQGAVSNAILSVLQRDGHPDSVVMAFVHKWLRPLFESRGADTEEVYNPILKERSSYAPVTTVSNLNIPGTLLYRFDEEEVKKALNKLNDWMYTCITNPSAPLDLPLDILAGLAPALCFPNYLTIHTQPSPLLKQIQQQIAALKKQREEVWKKLKTVKHGKESDALLDKEEAINREISLQTTLLAPAGCQFFHTILKQQRAGGVSSPDVQRIQEGFTYHGNAKLEEAAAAAYLYEQAQYELFCFDLERCIKALRVTPILSSSRYAGVASSAQNMTDAQKVLQKQLVNLGRYCAMVKVSTFEGLVQTLPLPAPSRHLPSLVAQIKMQNERDGYIRQKGTIEKEIRERRSRSLPSPALPEPSQGGMVPVPFAGGLPPDLAHDLPDFEDDGAVVVESVPDYTEEEQRYIRLHTALNGSAPMVLPSRETPQEKYIRLFRAMNGYNPPSLPAHLRAAPAPPGLPSPSLGNGSSRSSQNEQAKKTRRGGRGKRTRVTESDEEE